MTTKEKINSVLNFFHSREHKLIGEKRSDGYSLSTYFDIEVSKVDVEIDFSYTILVNDLSESIELMDILVGVNKNIEKIENDLKNRLDHRKINYTDSFFLIFKGNRRN
ncbi:hypothetical protein [Aquimarina sp. 2304DJ70-9]|uniref:hypothetical protein n=1 Tax=Aquimarina penaris TaxID=3231044 RepID=UPI003462FFD4